MNVVKFFQNDKGEWKVAQAPNVLLSLWLVVQVLNLVVFHSKQTVITTLGSLLLFAWAYNELTKGESLFRKVLGGVVLFIILINLFRQW